MVNQTCAHLYEKYPSAHLPPPTVNPNLPPMGYNPYNHLGGNATQEQVLSAAHHMATNGMRDAGYQFVDLDDGWQGSRDILGNITANEDRFSCGIAPLAQYVHDSGFRFGIYTSASGTSCGNLEGSGGHLKDDVRQFAKWEVDLIKLDWCGASYNKDDANDIINEWLTAIHENGRPMTLMVNVGGEWGILGMASKLANSFRVEGDICGTWQFDAAVRACYHQGVNLGVKEYLLLDWDRLGRLVTPGHFPDPDMMEIGNGLNWNESLTQFTMWAMWSAPLIAGNDVTTMKPGDVPSEVMLNRAIIAIDQDPLAKPARLINQTADVQYWRKEVADGVVLAAINLGEQSAMIRITMDQVNVQNVQTVSDPWSGNRFVPTSYYDSKLAPHAVRVLKFSTRP
jgi:alpha-galactosidase